MRLMEIVQKQIERDRRRGFRIDFDSDNELIQQLMNDVVGLTGEVGEFANLLKKVALHESIPGYLGPSLDESRTRLREELADAAIYIIRLSYMLDGNLEQDILEKIDLNDERYKHLES